MSPLPKNRVELDNPSLMAVVFASFTLEITNDAHPFCSPAVLSFELLNFKSQLGYFRGSSLSPPTHPAQISSHSEFRFRRRWYRIKEPIEA